MAKTIVNVQWEKDFYRAANNFVNSYAKAVTKKAEELLTQKAASAIQKFYEDYSPNFYVRTKNLLKHSYESYFHNNGKTYYGGVRIGSDSMFENYEATAAQVAWSGWHGWHGTPEFNEIGVMNPEPIDMIVEYMRSSKFRQNIIGYGVKNAKYDGKWFNKSKMKKTSNRPHIVYKTSHS